jgi:L-fuconolactonase
MSNAFVDTHVHLWSAEHLPPWLSDPALESIAVTRSVADHAAAAGEGLAKAVYMEVDVAPEQREEEARSVVALCADESNSLVGAVIGAPVVDGTLEEFEEYVRRWAAEPAVKGVRQVLHIQPKGTCLRADVVAKAKLCGELGLVFELCMRCDELTDVAELAKQVPNCRFVLDHGGGHHQLSASTPAEKREAWEAGIRALAQQPNVWCKVRDR